MLIAPWHFSFTVSNIEQSIFFYRDVLGMELMHRQEQANEYTRKFVGYPDAASEGGAVPHRGAADCTFRPCA